MKAKTQSCGTDRIPKFLQSRHFVFAAIFCSITALGFSAARAQEKTTDTQRSAPRTEESAPQISKYEVINATIAEPAGTFMLDTAKGIIWEMLVDEDGRFLGFGKVKMTAAPKVESVVTGRFRFVPSGAKRTGQFVVDTATGQVWAWGSDGRRSFFNPLPVEGLSE